MISKRIGGLWSNIKILYYAILHFIIGCPREALVPFQATGVTHRCRLCWGTVRMPWNEVEP